MADISVSKSGVFIEQDENGRNVKVVTSQPERGIQLVPPGGEITPDAQARIDAAKASFSGEAVRGGPAPVANVAAKPSK